MGRSGTVLLDPTASDELRNALNRPYTPLACILSRVERELYHAVESPVVRVP